MELLSLDIVSLELLSLSGSDQFQSNCFFFNTVGVIIVEVIVLLAALYYNPNAERKRHAAEKEGDIRNDPDVGSDEDIVPVSIEEGGQKVSRESWT